MITPSVNDVKSKIITGSRKEVEETLNKFLESIKNYCLYSVQFQIDNSEPEHFVWVLVLYGPPR